MVSLLVLHGNGSQILSDWWSTEIKLLTNFTQKFKTATTGVDQSNQLSDVYFKIVKTMMGFCDYAYCYYFEW